MTEQVLLAALEESVKLQSHYAELLNMHDGGERRTFANAQEWIDRLAAVTVTGHSRPAQTPLDPEEIRKANHAIARWLSAALEDPAVCEAMKSDINRWFEAHEPWPSPLTSTERAQAAP